MIKKHLVSTGIITALLIANGVVGYQYHQDSKEFDKQLNDKNEQYQELKVSYTNVNELLVEKEDEIKANQDAINNLNNDKSKLNDENTKLNGENNELKETIKQNESKINNLEKQLSEARNKESPSP